MAHWRMRREELAQIGLAMPSAADHRAYVRNREMDRPAVGPWNFPRGIPDVMDWSIRSRWHNGSSPGPALSRSDSRTVAIPGSDLLRGGQPRMGPGNLRGLKITVGFVRPACDQIGSFGRPCGFASTRAENRMPAWCQGPISPRPVAPHTGETTRDSRCRKKFRGRPANRLPFERGWGLPAWSCRGIGPVECRGGCPVLLPPKNGRSFWESRWRLADFGYRDRWLDLPADGGGIANRPCRRGKPGPKDISESCGPKSTGPAAPSCPTGRPPHHPETI
ncbi:MAG: hypothetical protein Ct9H300mP1_28550 [Planctomycetaceae bacterium]|nr:MAG: hypothetical protein Ct9H300mP1_28550 [Planctomycetaceae bacterium]